MRKLTWITILAGFVAYSAPALAGDPIAETKKIIDDETSGIRALVLEAKDDASLQEGVKKRMERFVDFEEFGRLCLGKRWKKLDDKQQALYLEEFRKLLQRTYLRRFKRGNDFKVTFRGEPRVNDKGDRIEVRTTIAGTEATADVDYRFHKVDVWKAYDIIVDEVSIMRNYRKSFIRVLKKDGFDALIEKMQKKTGEKDEQ